MIFWNCIMKDLVKALISLIFLIKCLPCYSYSDKIYSSTQIIDDLNIMDSIIRTVHPNPFYYVDENKYIQKKEEIMHVVSQFDSLSISEAYKNLAPFISILRDGHSLLLMPSALILKEYNEKVFPIKIKIINGKVYAKYDFYKRRLFPEKTEILEINNFSIKELLKNLYELYPVENSEEMFYTTIEKDFGALLYCYLNLKEDLLLRMGNPRLDEYRTKLVSYSSIKNSFDVNGSKAYDFQLNETSDSAYIVLKNFLPIPQYYDFIHKSFREIKNKGIKYLKIDVRGNKGGASYAVDSLMAYICNKPYRLYDSVFVRISKPVLTKLIEKKSELINQIDTSSVDQILRLSPPYISPSRNVDFYDGQLEVLIDKETYSGASTFANAVKVMDCGSVIGDSDAKNIYFGDFLFFQLPNTKMLFSVSTREFVEYSGTRKANRVGI